MESSSVSAVTRDSTAASPSWIYSLFPRNTEAEVKLYHYQRSSGDPAKDFGVGSYMIKSTAINNNEYIK